MTCAGRPVASLPRRLPSPNPATPSAALLRCSPTTIGCQLLRSGTRCWGLAGTPCARDTPARDSWGAVAVDATTYRAEMVMYVCRVMLVIVKGIEEGE